MKESNCYLNSNHIWVNTIHETFFISINGRYRVFVGPAEEVEVPKVGARGGGQLGGREPHGSHVEHGVLVPEYQYFGNLSTVVHYRLTK